MNNFREYYHETILKELFQITSRKRCSPDLFFQEGLRTLLREEAIFNHKLGIRGSPTSSKQRTNINLQGRTVSGLLATNFQSPLLLPSGQTP